MIDEIFLIVWGICIGTAGSIVFFVRIICKLQLKIKKLERQLAKAELNRFLSPIFEGAIDRLLDSIFGEKKK